jgi:tRNA threonylcarbamoyladenosine biosynthesis protein TsaB
VTPGRLLAVETATRVLSVALLDGSSGVLLAEISTEDPRPHSERLLPAVDRVLALAGTALDEVDAFAVSIGPGSFTGLRVGLATVKAFAFGSGRPVAAVPTLAALAARAAGAPGCVAAALDARRGELYAACWKTWEAEGAPRVAESVWGPEALARRLPRGTTLVVGEDVDAPAHAVAEAGQELRLLTGAAARPRALDVGRLALRQLAAGEGLPAHAVVPRYLRRAEAEARRTGRPLEDPSE